MKPIKQAIIDLENMKLLSYDSMPTFIKKLSKDLIIKIEDVFIQGLKHKGFEFETKIELIEFLQNCCRCEDNTQLRQKTYFVNNIPFLLHKYEPNSPAKLIIEEGSLTMKQYSGSFIYL